MFSIRIRQKTAKLTATIFLFCATVIQAQDIFVPREKRAQPVRQSASHPPGPKQPLHNQIQPTPAVPRATRASPCLDLECVETFWEDRKGNGLKDWSEPLRPVQVDKQFAVPMYLASWPVRPFTIMGYVYVLYKPNTHNPQTSAVRALADLAKRHGAEAVSLRPRKMLGRWYAAGTAIRWAKK